MLWHLIKLTYELIASGFLGSVSPPTTVETELWAGHQISFGERKIPFKGNVQTRTDTYILARVHKQENQLKLIQKACQVKVSPVAGVQVSVPADRLQVNAIQLVRDQNQDYQGSSRVRWQTQDVDNDGFPGMTVGVRAPVCSGDLYVTNDASTKATATLTDAGLRGFASVTIHQQVIGAKGVCLSVVAKDVKEQVRGPFAYTRVNGQEDCQSLLRKPWPVQAG